MKMSDGVEQNLIYKFDNIIVSDENYVEKPKTHKICCILLFLVVLVSIAAVITGVILFTNSRTKRNDSMKDNSPRAHKVIKNLDEFCTTSREAQKLGLEDFLKKCQALYFEIFPHEEFEMTTKQRKSKELIKQIAVGFKPFVPTPYNIKQNTDRVLGLWRELQSFEIIGEELKPKEHQVLEEVRLFLKQMMSTDFESGFYQGGWMFGPNYFCFNRICRLQNEIHSLTYYFRPTTVNDVENLMHIFLMYNATFNQYIKNLQLGVKSGMIKSDSSCQAGENAFKEVYFDIINYHRLPSITNNLRATDLYSEISDEAYKEWRKKYKQSIPQSLYSALIHGFVKPARRYFEYLSTEYRRHCPPDHIASGLASIPVTYEYEDGKPIFERPTTRKLPITNAALNGKELYNQLLERYVTMNVSADIVYEKGVEQMKKHHSKIVELAKAYTNTENEDEAMTRIRRRLHADDQWHGETSFPEIESNATAYSKCVDEQSAKQFCPIRWKSMEKWKSYLYGVLGMIRPRLNNIFYHTGDKKSVPNCPIKILPHFNPSMAAMIHEPSDIQCTTPSIFFLPFFLERYGPKYTEWSTTGHETRPGHHFQVQGSIELFSSPCHNNIQSFFHSKGYFSGFVEGWALYAENPVLSDDVLLYEDNMLQKLGMYKMQLWHALRLVIDSGLHSQGKNKDWALKMLRKYGLDDTDFSRKEVMRYMSAPGQAVSYMMGQLEFIRAREKVEEETLNLGTLFNVEDFHYQVLSLGSTTLEYLSKYVDRYLKCLKEPSRKFCEYMFTPVRSIQNDSDSNKNALPKQPTTTQKNRYFL